MRRKCSVSAEISGHVIVQRSFFQRASERLEPMICLIARGRCSVLASRKLQDPREVLRKRAMYSVLLAWGQWACRWWE